MTAGREAAVIIVMMIITGHHSLAGTSQAPGRMFADVQKSVARRTQLLESSRFACELRCGAEESQMWPRLILLTALAGLVLMGLGGWSAIFRVDLGALGFGVSERVSIALMATGWLLTAAAAACWLAWWLRNDRSGRQSGSSPPKSSARGDTRPR